MLSVSQVEPLLLQVSLQENPLTFPILQVALILIDEVHLLNESRGAALEAGVVSRIKMISSLNAMKEVRFLSTSRTPSS